MRKEGFGGGRLDKEVDQEYCVHFGCEDAPSSINKTAHKFLMGRFNYIYYTPSAKSGAITPRP
jgi:hypothetical protein